MLHIITIALGVFGGLWMFTKWNKWSERRERRAAERAEAKAEAEAELWAEAQLSRYGYPKSDAMPLAATPEPKPQLWVAGVSPLGPAVTTTMTVTAAVIMALALIAAFAMSLHL